MSLCDPQSAWEAAPLSAQAGTAEAASQMWRDTIVSLREENERLRRTVDAAYDLAADQRARNTAEAIRQALALGRAAQIRPPDPTTAREAESREALFWTQTVRLKAALEEAEPLLSNVAVLAHVHFALAEAQKALGAAASAPAGDGEASERREGGEPDV